MLTSTSVYIEDWEYQSVFYLQNNTINIIKYYKISETMIEDWISAIEDGLPWPMVHIFLPALLYIYIDNVWICLSLIYIFESVEFIISELPGAEYWAEDSKVDTLVSDILMGLLGFWVAYGFRRGIQDSYSWYAYLQPITTSPQWYQKWSGLIHVLIAAASTLIITVGGNSEIVVPMFYQFAVFGGLYVLFALLFGYPEWAIFSGLCISVITLFAILYEHTVIVSTIVVVFFAILFRTFRPQLTEQKTPEAERTPLISKQSLLRRIEIDF
mgnify:FL=1